MSQAERKSRRKSTRKRVGQAETSEHYTFRPTPEQWAAFEEAYGQRLPDTLRDQIAEAVQSYFGWEPFERHAPFADDVLNYVEQVRKAAIALQRAPARAVPPNAASYARINLASLFADPRLGESGRLETFRSIIRNFVSACDSLKGSVVENKGFEEGDAWRSLIRKLRRHFEDHGFRAKASKDSDKRNGRPSPFVAFVRALQATFPPALVRHHHSDDALSKAVSDALKPVKRDARGAGPANEGPNGTFTDE